MPVTPNKQIDQLGCKYGMQWKGVMLKGEQLFVRR